MFLKKLTSGIFLILFTQSVSAETQRLKTGWVDMQAIAYGSNLYKSMVGELNKKFAPKRESLQKLMNEHESKSKTIAKPPANLSQQKLQELKISVQKLAFQLEKESKALKADMNNSRAEMEKELLAKIQQEIVNFSIKEKYDYVFNKEGLFYAKGHHELTKQILEMINRNK